MNYQSKFIADIGLRPFSFEGLRRYLDYNAETGLFTFKAHSRSSKVGTVAGCKSSSSGYVFIGIAKRLYAGHRLAWFYVHGVWPSIIDHKNGDTSDNRLANLREATSSENMGNRKVSKNNALGIKGVHRVKYGYRAMLSMGNQVVWSKTFRTVEAAQSAYAEKHKETFGDFFNAG